MDWTRQVVTLVQNEDFYPHPIRRELKPILDLFTEKNLGHIRGQDGAVNITDMAGWLSDYYRQVVQCPLQRSRTVETGVATPAILCHEETTGLLT